MNLTGLLWPVGFCLACIFTEIPQLMDYFRHLRNPYPLNLNRWSTIILISLFVGFFLAVFQPFGLHNVQADHKTALLAGYGLVTFAVLLLNMILLPAVVPGLLNEDSWTVWKQIIWLCWIVITIAAANYLYSVAFDIFPRAGVRGLMAFLGFTLAVALIPIAGVTLISQNVYLRRNRKNSLEINAMIGRKMSGTPHSGANVSLISESRKPGLTLDIDDLIFVESVGNYVNIHYLEEGTPGNKMIRSALKKMESQLTLYGNLFRCHRAFIINLNHVERVKGNSQGYSLIMKHADREIPVARSYTKSFREAMNK